MSYHTYRIDSLHDETRMMKEMIAVRDRVRVAKEKERRSKSEQTRRYTQMFSPITNSLKRMKSSQVPTVENSTNTDTPYYADNPQSVDAASSTHSNAVPDEEDEEKHVAIAGDLFMQALDSVPASKRSDGAFGLDTETQSIGDRAYFVDGDVLNVVDVKEQVVSRFEITDLQLWQLLLVKRPSSIHLKPDNNTLKQFADIVHQLDLVNIARKNHGSHVKKRAKYLLLPTDVVGRGFLFSTVKPELVHPSTVIIPSNKRELLKALIKCVAELRSGNTSMQNVVVPLAQEASRLKILPPGLLRPDEMTWVFA